MMLEFPYGVFTKRKIAHEIKLIVGTPSLNQTEDECSAKFKVKPIGKKLNVKGTNERE